MLELLPVVFLILAVLTVVMAVKRVPQGFEWTVERFGKFRRTLQPGLSFIIPYVDIISNKVNMKERVLDVPSQEVITLDNAVVRVDGVVFYQVLDPVKSSYNVNNLQRATLNLTMTNIRTVLGSMSLDQSLSNRDQINAQLLHVVDEATSPWGVKVTRIEIKDIAPPQDLVDSMARQMKAERDKRAEILTSEGYKQSEILKAEGEKQAAILDADGRLEAAKRDAAAREALAKAEANATAMVSDAISSGDIQAVNYFVATKYVDALSTIGSAENQKIIMLPLEASSLMGSIAGISEIAKSALSDKS
jgi:regulator of protease activity HflC (stomatin/prohibitin superfamily)